MKPRIYLGINALSSVHAKVYMNHLCQMYALGKSGKYEIILHTVPRKSIDRMRNECAQGALLSEADYLFFIDDDMVLSDGTLDSLIDANKDIVMAHTFIRGYPFPAMSWYDDSPNKDLSSLQNFNNILEKVTPENRGVVDCAAVGFATVLIKTWLLKKLDPPYFITSSTGTEDIYFCIRCQSEIEEPVSIAVDTRVPTGHLLEPEIITPSTKYSLKEYYQNQYGVKDESAKRGDRGEDYLRMVEAIPDFVENFNET